MFLRESQAEQSPPFRVPFPLSAIGLLQALSPAPRTKRGAENETPRNEEQEKDCRRESKQETDSELRETQDERGSSHQGNREEQKGEDTG